MKVNVDYLREELKSLEKSKLELLKIIKNNVQKIKEHKDYILTAKHMIKYSLNKAISESKKELKNELKRSME